MKQPKVEKEFRKQFAYWSKHLKVSKVKLIRDNRISSLASVYYEGKIPCLEFSSKNLADEYHVYHEIIHTVFHELAHIKKKALYTTMSDEKAEYIAESQAIKWLLKYYPLYAQARIRYMNKALKSDSVYEGAHLIAYRKIKEYGYERPKKNR